MTVHGPGQFTGEVNMLAGLRSLVRARASATGEVFEIDRERLLAVALGDSESEILMRAFILRRGSLPASRCQARRSTGAEYHKPPLENLRRFEGVGVYYGATFMESQLCVSEDIVVVGGRNSTGQAAVFLAHTARRVHLLVRSKGVAETMSRYLIRRIEQHPGIDLQAYTELIALEGESHLEKRALAQ